MIKCNNFSARALVGIQCSRAVLRRAVTLRHDEQPAAVVGERHALQLVQVPELV
jgi:hypothetical protein